jgi:hypothetical protein
MANSTTAGVHVEEIHWAYTTLSHLDTWCGATCHTVLRYVLRWLLVFALAGTFVAILMRSVDPKRRAELNTSRLLEKSELGSLTGSFSGNGKSGQVLSVGPDVKDSCAVM